MRFTLLASLLALVLLCHRHAEAACGNPCTISVDGPHVEPALDCIEVQAVDDDCNCGISLRLTNSCEAPVIPQGFSIRCVYGTEARECTSINPGEKGSVPYETPEPGRQEHVYTVSVNGNEHTITVVTDVTFKEQGCACRMGPLSSGGPQGWLMMGAALFALSRRWQRRRRAASD